MGMRGVISDPERGVQQRSIPVRIRSTYLFLRQILSLAAEDRASIKRVVAASARWRPDSIVIRSVLAPPTMQDVIAELTESDGDGSHGFARRRRTGVFKPIRMPVWDRFTPAEQTARPAGGTCCRLSTPIWWRCCAPRACWCPV